MRKRCLVCTVLGVLLLGVSAAVSSAADPTGTIRGRVYDAEVQEPLFSANVIITSLRDPSFKVGRYTDAEGRFTIEDLPPGPYEVRASYIGYTTLVLDEVAVTSGGESTVSLPLAVEPIAMKGVVVSASRREEKALDAPAAVDVVDHAAIERRASLTVTDHVADLPSVDVVDTGLNSSNVVVRGFNNIFSGALLVLNDNRFARVPSLRLNAYQFIPTVNSDIERIEIVSGPGSALYGPNSASGVMHIVTRSPFDSRGTQLTFTAGERSLFTGSLRHAGVINDRIGYKVTSEIQRGDDWESFDGEEPEFVIKGRQTSSGRVDVGGSVPNTRDFDIEKQAGEIRFDVQLTDEATGIVAAGFTEASNIELTGLGAAQAVDWRYSYLQARFLWKNLFVQGFVNASDAGDTYLLRTGDLIVDESKLWVGQIQHSYRMGERQNFIYGADGIFTRPNTDGTINGQNEDDDDINEIGGYVQSETDLSEKFHLVLAARVDDHNRIDDAIFSPRAALVWKPETNHNLRATYNRAFSTPTSNNLFLDILSKADAFGTGALFEPTIGFDAGTNVRAQATPETGYSFNYDSSGNPMFRSDFAPLGGLTESDYIAMDDPVFTNVMWGLGRGAGTSGLAAALQAAGTPQGTIDALTAALDVVVPAQLGGLTNRLLTLDPNAPEGASPFGPADPVTDFDRVSETTTETFELGYKGILGDKVAFTVNAYRTEIEDFVGPLIVETPNVFLDPTTLAGSLGSAFAGTFAANPADSLVVTALDDPLLGGNGNGTAQDELLALYADAAGGIPFGTVSPNEAVDPTAVILAYRNFGDISLWGGEIGLTYVVNDAWSASGTYAYVSEDLFPAGADQPHDITLNAPKHKASLALHYRNPSLGFRGDIRGRWTDAFPVNSGVYIGSVDAFTVVDLNADYSLPIETEMRVGVTVKNLFDNGFKPFVGTPEIGRLAVARVTVLF